MASSIQIPAEVEQDSEPGPLPLRRNSAWSRMLSQTMGLTKDIRAVALIAIGSSVLSVWNLTNAPDFQDDEGTYTAQAISVTKGSLAPYTYWYDHPPLGWIQLGALSWIPRLLFSGVGTEIGNMRYVVSFFFVASSVLIFLIARRLLIRMTFSVLAVALFCLSPLSLVLGRQVFLDNVATPWLLLAFYLALSPRLALWPHIGAGVCFAVAVLSKETLAIFGPALLIALVHRSRWRTRMFSIVGFLTVGALILSFYPLAALLRGELLSGAGHVSLQDALSYQFFSRSGSGSIWQAGSSRAQLVTGWMYYDKYLILAGLVAAAVCLVCQRSRWISAGVALFVLPVAVGTGYLPTMYIIATIPLLVLAIGMAADTLWGAVHRAFPAGSRHHRTVGALTAIAMVGGLVMMSVPQWFVMDKTLLSGANNSDWYKTLNWTKANVPKTETVLAPYSMWQDLTSSGLEGPWQVIALEKMDLDTDFAVHHPQGWRDVAWIVEGPSVKPNISYLHLTNAGMAIEHSKIVQSYGEWHIRRVVTGPVGTPLLPFQSDKP